MSLLAEMKTTKNQLRHQGTLVAPLAAIAITTGLYIVCLHSFMNNTCTVYSLLLLGGKLITNKPKLKMKRLKTFKIQQKHQDLCRTCGSLLHEKGTQNTGSKISSTFLYFWNRFLFIFFYFVSPNVSFVTEKCKYRC